MLCPEAARRRQTPHETERRQTRPVADASGSWGRVGPRSVLCSSSNQEEPKPIEASMSALGGSVGLELSPTCACPAKKTGISGGLRREWG